MILQIYTWFNKQVYTEKQIAGTGTTEEEAEDEAALEDMCLTNIQSQDMMAKEINVPYVWKHISQVNL
jgi:hypothetical protein